MAKEKNVVVNEEKELEKVEPVAPKKLGKKAQERLEKEALGNQTLVDILGKNLVEELYEKCKAKNFDCKEVMKVLVTKFNRDETTVNKRKVYFDSYY